jgi:ATP-dependent Clp protease ATP-binding subunit ClpB
MEYEALKRESDAKSIERRGKVDEVLKQKQREYDELNSEWNSEQRRRRGAQSAQEKLDNARKEFELAYNKGDLVRASEYKYVTIPRLEEELKDYEKIVEAEVVREEDVATVISKQTGIPISRLLTTEIDRLLHMEDNLRKRVIGQDHALEKISNSIRISRAGLHSHSKPIGAFLFLGPTGVGKTELAKELAEYLFDDENAITRIDMSEYQERHSVSRLVGAPPGYVGYDEGGQLTEAVRRKPYSVILLDEIEKAHADTFNILLQVLDEGRLTDNKGRLADFKNTIIIMTSNMGSAIIQEKFENLKGGIDAATEAAKTEVLGLLKQTVRPEFINRIDEIVMFTPLTAENIKEIVSLQLKSVTKMLANQYITLDATPEAINYLAQKGYDPQFGARPVKRVIQREVLNKLSKEILGGTVKTDSIILLDSFNGELVFRNQSELVL